MPDETQITDAEIVGETTVAPSGDSSAQVLINMEGMIKNYMSSIDRLSAEVKKHKEMLDDIFANDSTFRDHKEKSTEAAKVLAGTKAQILKQPQAADLAEKVKTLKSELKESQDALSDYLQEYARMSGVNEIEGEDGYVREIVYTAKLIRRS